MALPKDKFPEPRVKFIYLLDFLGAYRYFKANELLPVYVDKQHTQVVTWEFYQDKENFKEHKKSKKYIDALNMEILNLLINNEA